MAANSFRIRKAGGGSTVRGGDAIRDPRQTQEITGVGGIVSAEAFGAPVVAVPAATMAANSFRIRKAGGGSTVRGGDAIRDPRQTQEITGVGGIVSAEAFGAPVVAVPAATSAGGGKIRRARRLRFSVEDQAPRVAHKITGVGGIVSAEAFGPPTVSVQQNVVQIRSRLAREQEEILLIAA